MMGLIFVFNEDRARELIKRHPEIFNDFSELSSQKSTDYNENWEQIIIRKIPMGVRYEVLKRQKWRCNSCGCTLKFNKNSEWEGEIAHIDHIHPFANKKFYINGQQNINELENLQGLCSKCNKTKYNRKD